MAVAPCTVGGTMSMYMSASLESHFNGAAGDGRVVWQRRNLLGRWALVSRLGRKSVWRVVIFGVYFFRKYQHVIVDKCGLNSALQSFVKSAELGERYNPESSGPQKALGGTFRYPRFESCGCEGR